MKRLSSPKAETRMVPGASNRLPHHQTFVKRPAVMAADGSDREQLAPLSCQENRLVAHVTQEHAAVGNCIRGDPSGEIGTCLRLCHR